MTRLSTEDAAQQTFESHFFDSDGVRLRYIDVGGSEPVLLIHGLAVDLEINYALPGVVGALRDAGYRVIAYDSRGHGLSDRPHDSAMYGPPEVEDAIRLLDHLGIQRAHVVGYSRGGFIASRLRARHPDRLLSVTLGGYGPGAEAAGSELASRMAATADSVEKGKFGPLVRMLNPDASAEEPEGLARTLADANDGPALAAAMRAGLAVPPLSTPSPGAEAVPTLAVLGDHDPFMNQVTRMRVQKETLQVLVVPGADHMSTIGRPELVTAILGFLAGHPARKPGPR